MEKISALNVACDCSNLWHKQRNKTRWINFRTVICVRRKCYRNDCRMPRLYNFTDSLRRLVWVSVNLSSILHIFWTCCITDRRKKKKSIKDFFNMLFITCQWFVQDKLCSVKWWPWKASTEQIICTCIMIWTSQNWYIDWCWQLMWISYESVIKCINTSCTTWGNFQVFQFLFSHFVEKNCYMQHYAKHGNGWVQEASES